MLRLLLVLAGAAWSANVPVSWDPVTINADGSLLTDLAGYRLFQSTRSLLGETTAQAMSDPLVTQYVAAPSTASYYVIGLNPGTTYYFRSTAFSVSGGQSDFNIDGVTLQDVQISTYFPASDTTPPSVAITTPAANSIVSGLVTLSATASDDAAVASVQFQVDGANLGSAITAPPYTTTWNTAGFKGSHLLTAIAQDSSGNLANAFLSVVVQRTNILLNHSATVSGQSNWALESNDPTFPVASTITAQVSMPSGVKIATFTQIAAPVLTYFAALPDSFFSAPDYSALDGTNQTVAVGAQTFNAFGEGYTLSPALGGLIYGPAGSNSSVQILPNGINLDAQILIRPMPPDAGGARAAASKKQGLLILGPGQDIVFDSSGALNAANLTLPFDPGLVPPPLTQNQASIGYFNAAAGLWEVVSNKTRAGSQLTVSVSHFSPYAPVLFSPSAIPGLRDSYVYPNPVLDDQQPTIRAFVGTVSSVDVTIFDVSGRQVHSGSVPGNPTGVYNGQFYYDYKWTGHIPSGSYFAVITARASDGSVVRGRTKFAVVR